MWTDYLRELWAVLTDLAATDKQGGSVSAEAAFELWTEWATGLGAGGSIFLVGNGASASMASHAAADITKNCGIRANVFTDLALITALGNDNGYENCYAVALDRYALPADLLVAISSSGDSPNIVNACCEAERIGLRIVTLSAKQPTNRIRKLGDLNIHIPASSFSLAESGHAAVMHHWMDRVEAVQREKGVR